MSLQQTVIDGVAQAKANLGDLLLTFSFKKKTGNSYVAGKNSPTFATPADLSGLFDKFSFDELDGVLVKVTDTKIVLFIDTNDQSPSMGDLLTYDGIEYQVVKPNPIYAGDKIVLVIVQARS